MEEIGSYILQSERKDSIGNYVKHLTPKLSAK